VPDEDIVERTCSGEDGSSALALHEVEKALCWKEHAGKAALLSLGFTLNQ